MIAFEENHHSILIVENYMLPYEDAAENVEYVAQHLWQTSREATVLYAHALDLYLKKMTLLADRVFCFARCRKQQLGAVQKPNPKMPKAQVTLKAYT